MYVLSLGARVSEVFLAAWKPRQGPGNKTYNPGPMLMITPALIMSKSFSLPPDPPPDLDFGIPECF